MKAPIIRQVTVQHPLLNLNVKECMVIEYLFEMRACNCHRNKGAEAHRSSSSDCCMDAECLAAQLISLTTMPGSPSGQPSIILGFSLN